MIEDATPKTGGAETKPPEGSAPAFTQAGDARKTPRARLTKWSMST